MCPPHLTKQQFGLGRVTVQKDVLQVGAVILLLFKGGCICLGEVGVLDLVYSVILVRTPEHLLWSSLLPGTQLILE